MRSFWGVSLPICLTSLIWGFLWFQDLDIQAGNERALIAQVLGTLAAMHDASSEAIVAMLAFYVEGDSMLQVCGVCVGGIPLDSIFVTAFFF